MQVRLFLSPFVLAGTLLFNFAASPSFALSDEKSATSCDINTNIGHGEVFTQRCEAWELRLRIMQSSGGQFNTAIASIWDRTRRSRFDISCAEEGPISWSARIWSESIGIEQERDVELRLSSEDGRDRQISVREAQYKSARISDYGYLMREMTVPGQSISVVYSPTPNQGSRRNWMPLGSFAPLGANQVFAALEEFCRVPARY